MLPGDQLCGQRIQMDSKWKQCPHSESITGAVMCSSGQWPGTETPPAVIEAGQT